MPNTNQNPIRVADLSEAYYVPRVPAKPPTEPYSPPSSVKPGVLDDKSSGYEWNSADDSQIGLPTSLHVGAPTATVNSAHHPSTSPALTPVSVHVDTSQTDAKLAWLESVASSPVHPSTNSNVNPEEAAHRTAVFPPTTRVWGIDYHSVDMAQTLDYLEKVIKAKRPTYAITANLNYAMLCAKNPRLASFTSKAALVLCDGMPILWRSKLNKTALPERVAGSDLIYHLTERCAEKKFRVYFYGASEGVAEKAAVNLKLMYPELLISGVQCPPFHACSPEQVRQQIAKIKKAKPDVLYIALGQPKGEYWIEDHLEELGVPLSIQLGASFDFVAGNAVRAPRIFQKTGFEWLYRTLRDPKRLAPRYFQNAMFLVNALRRDMIEWLT